jgi:aerobic carbon-monoxide dehydrogenase medium subunit
MKAAAFFYRRPASLREAASILADNEDAKVIAGGQTLGPMLNLRLSQPALLVDITRIAEAKTVTETANSVIYGACVTHANFEDGRVPDPTGGFLARVARGIAYRAVRTRGTIGGSLAHADPAADWLSALLALDCEIHIQGPKEARTLPLKHFAKGALSTDLAHGETIASISVNRPERGTQFGYAKLCRKIGEFPEAIGAVRRNVSGTAMRLVAGALGGAPIVIEDGAEFIAHRRLDHDRLGDRLVAGGLRDDPYERAIHIAVLERALDDSWTA